MSRGIEDAAPAPAWSGSHDAIHDAIVVGNNAITTGFTFLVKSRAGPRRAAAEIDGRAHAR
jgi:hypothetical protein